MSCGFAQIRQKTGHNILFDELFFQRTFDDVFDDVTLKNKIKSADTLVCSRGHGSRMSSKAARGAGGSSSSARLQQHSVEVKCKSKRH